MLAAAFIFALHFGLPTRAPQVIQCSSGFIDQNTEANTRTPFGGPSLEIPIGPTKGNNGLFKAEAPRSFQIGPGYTVSYRAADSRLTLSIAMDLFGKNPMPVQEIIAPIDVKRPVDARFLLPNVTAEGSTLMHIHCELTSRKSK